MNKERLGAFIGDCRRELGLTQRELAEKVHVTDKAVSKWERGLSYPDVTLLEPLAAALGLGVEELMACRRQAVLSGEEDPVKNLLTISDDSLRRERRRSWGRLGAVLALLIAAGLVIAWNALYVSQDRLDVIDLKETVEGVNYIYVEEDGHLLKLECENTVDLNDIQTGKDEWGHSLTYQITCRWNRLTREGTVSELQSTGNLSWEITESRMDEGESPLFGFPMVYRKSEQFYPDPSGNGYLCDIICWVYTNLAPFDSEDILRVEDCVSAVPWDTDDDGVNELVVRTRWPEKPYTVYDCVDGEIVETWPDTVPEEVREALVQIWEQ